MTEHWRPVVRWEKYYEVSDQGRVRSLPRTYRHGRNYKTVTTKPGRLLTLRFDEQGRPKMLLKGDGRQEQLRVCRMVLEAFVGPCPDGLEACHYPDRNVANNWLTNLRWDTRSENNRDQVRHGTHANASKVECKYGHPLDGRRVDGRRFCKTCAWDCEQARRPRHR